jgi:hypothetical protein
MDASTNVFDVDDSDDLLQFTDRLRDQHTAKEIMSLKLLKLLRLTGAPHYAYTSIMDIFADALASKIVTAGATFRQRDTTIKHFANRFCLEKLFPTTLTKHMNGCTYPVVLHDAEVTVETIADVDMGQVFCSAHGHLCTGPNDVLDCTMRLWMPCLPPLLNDKAKVVFRFLSPTVDSTTM